MWEVYGTGLEMTEGDYGVSLPVRVGGATFEADDSLIFTFKAASNGAPVLEKEYEYADINDNVVLLSFDEEETKKFEANHSYVYSLDWYRDEAFLCNIIRRGVLKVVDKA